MLVLVSLVVLYSHLRPVIYWQYSFFLKVKSLDMTKKMNECLWLTTRGQQWALWHLCSNTSKCKSVDVFFEVWSARALKSLLVEGHCMPNHCSWSAHCAASLSLPSRSPSSPLPSISSPSSSTVASVGLSSFSIFCMPSRDFWSFGSRLRRRNRTISSARVSG